jgi:hypothetical protein
VHCLPALASLDPARCTHRCEKCVRMVRYTCASTPVCTASLVMECFLLTASACMSSSNVASWINTVASFASCVHPTAS